MNKIRTNTKPGEVLLLEIQTISSAHGLPMADAFIDLLFGDGRTIPYLWLGRNTDSLLSKVLFRNVQRFSEEPQLPRDIRALHFIEPLVLLACRFPFTGTTTGPNNDAVRFQLILDGCVFYWTADQAAICYWILSQSFLSESSRDHIFDSVGFWYEDPDAPYVMAQFARICDRLQGQMMVKRSTLTEKLLHWWSLFMWCQLEVYSSEYFYQRILRRFC